jgi:hypothetical protein
VATYVDLDALGASTLRHLAALREDRERERYIDYEAMAMELAELLVDGRRPTIGWYRRHLRPVPGRGASQWRETDALPEPAKARPAP